MRISIGNGGWVGVDGLDLPGPLYVRVRAVDGRLRIVELYIDASDGADAIDARDLRELPLSQVEAFINAFAEDVTMRADLISPDLSTLASYYATAFGRTAQQVAEGNWVVSSFAAQQVRAFGADRAVLRGDQLLTEDDATAALAADPGLGRVMWVARAERAKGWRGVRSSEREFRMTAGPVDGLTDAFLHDLARAYRAAVARGERPNVAIAEQTRYPVKSVQRWVYTARQRGVMPRGQKGKTG